MNTPLQPARVLPPGHILKLELEAREWTQRDLAAIMERPPQAIGEIIRGKKQITPETAIELAGAFGTSPDFWINLETNYRLFLARQTKVEETKIARKSKMYHLAPITEMIKRGWIQQTEAIEELEQNLCRFLRIPTLDTPPQMIAQFRCSTERNPTTNAQIAWLSRVIHLVEHQQVGAFSLATLQESFSTLLGFRKHASSVQQVPPFLQEIGIYCVFVPHLPNTYIDGATFTHNEHPVIALSLRYDRIDTFWFTLMHELAHITLQHQGAYLDMFDDEEEQTREEEIVANKQAKDWLIDQQALERFILQTSPYFSRKKIEQFAMEQQVHPGIVVGQLHHEGWVKYTHLRQFLVKVKPFLEDWIDVPTPKFAV